MQKPDIEFQGLYACRSTQRGIRMFGKKKAAAPQVPFDKEKQKAVIRCSICTGEQVAGFRDRQTGHFTEIMLIRNSEDLEIFMKMYDLPAVTKEY